MEYGEIKKKISELLAEQKMLEGQLLEAITSAIKETAKESPTKRKVLSRNAYVIRLSDMEGSVWSPSFYDWEKTAEVVIEYLKGSNPSEWKDKLDAKLAEAKNGTITFKKYIGSCFGQKSYDNIPVSELFIKKVIEKLD